MKISSNYLFHFTPKLEFLLSIIRNGFWPRYCKEDASLVGEIEKTMFFPMVCFCDIPKHSIMPHINEYGKFGMIMHKSWGKKKGINPILYAHHRSMIYKSYLKQLQIQLKINSIANIESYKEISKISSKGLYDSIMILAHVKPYEGMNRNGKVKRFYDEREWRYIPRGAKNFITLDDLDSIEEHNDKTVRYNLNFNPRDLKGIVIPSEKYRESLINEIENKKLTDKQKNNMIEKILTLKELNTATSNRSYVKALE